MFFQFLGEFLQSNVKISNPNPVSVLLIFQPRLNAQTQFQHSFSTVLAYKNLAENKLQN
jgi:hypothetical protein